MRRTDIDMGMPRAAARASPLFVRDLFLYMSNLSNRSPCDQAGYFVKLDISDKTKPQSDTAAPPKTRPCLVCSTPFESAWAGERVCRRCKSGKAWRSGVSTSKTR